MMVDNPMNDGSCWQASNQVSVMTFQGLKDKRHFAIHFTKIEGCHLFLESYFYSLLPLETWSRGRYYLRCIYCHLR